MTLGRSGLTVRPLGLSTGGGKLAAADVERAVERGLDYLYFGTLRGSQFARAVRGMKARRDKLVLVVQSYTRIAALMRPSLELGLRALGTDHADMLLLGWWSAPPPRKILDAALALREKGLTRHVMISCHDRRTFETYINDPSYAAIMVRYNAAHPGAQTEVFPVLQPDRATRPGVVAYTATRWGDLLDPAMCPANEPQPRASDCYRFALTAPDVNVCLTAPSDGAQLDEALAALDRGPMSADELAWMTRVGAAVRTRRAKDPRRSPVQLADQWMDKLRGGNAVER